MGASMKPSGPNLLVVGLGHNEARARGLGPIQFQEVYEGFIKVKGDGAFVHDFNALGLILVDVRVGATVILVGEFYVLGGYRLPVVEGNALSQPEGGLFKSRLSSAGLPPADRRNARWAWPLLGGQNTFWRKAE